MNETAVINVRLPEEVTKLIDDLVAEKLFNNRSEAVREFLREHILSGERN